MLIRTQALVQQSDKLVALEKKLEKEKKEREQKEREEKEKEEAEAKAAAEEKELQAIAAAEAAMAEEKELQVKAAADAVAKASAHRAAMRSMFPKKSFSSTLQAIRKEQDGGGEGRREGTLSSLIGSASFKSFLAMASKPKVEWNVH
jgi:membrane protein involved in colicin uptake